MKQIDWDNKEESIERLRELYPSLKGFMLELCFDIYQQFQLRIFQNLR